jgi:hypothetical protein
VQELLFSKTQTGVGVPVQLFSDGTLYVENLVSPSTLNATGTETWELAQEAVAEEYWPAANEVTLAGYEYIPGPRFATDATDMVDCPVLREIERVPVWFGGPEINAWATLL